MTAEQIAGACRWLDDTTAESSPDQVLQKIGLQREDVRYVADQRALRILMILKKYAPTTVMKAIEVTGTEEALLDLLSAASFDGICTGIAASQGKSSPMPNKESLN